MLTCFRVQMSKFVDKADKFLFNCRNLFGGQLFIRTQTPTEYIVGQSIAFDKGVPIANAFVLGYLFEYRHKLYTAKARFFRLHFYCRHLL